MAVGACLAAALAALSPVRAADVWPARPVHIVVPFATGSGIDQVARTYAEARHRFHLAAELNGSKVKVYKHPMTGPNGEEMASDVVFLGNLDAKAVMVVTSGVHGPELFCGSGAQIDVLLEQIFEGGRFAGAQPAGR